MSLYIWYIEVLKETKETIEAHNVKGPIIVLCYIACFCGAIVGTMQAILKFNKEKYF